MQSLLDAHKYLAEITAVDDPEIFKVCLDYWHMLAKNLYHEAPFVQSPLMLGSMQQSATPRRGFYAMILSQVRYIIISRMAKPEEVDLVLTL